MRSERRSIAITSTRALEEWPEVFGHGLLASAALDRLTHHAQILIIQGRSYRQLGRQKGGLPSDPVTDAPTEEGPSSARDPPPAGGGSNISPPRPPDYHRWITPAAFRWITPGGY